WVYLRRHEAFIRFRNAILLANVIGLVGYVLLPTAPPRMFPDFGFDDTLSQFASLNHGSGLVNFVANPYAAMPSLHAADALIVGIVLFAVCRNWFAKAVWALWPGWVWFSVMATGNHFWLDVAAGVVVALVALGFVYGRPLRRRRLVGGSGEMESVPPDRAARPVAASSVAPIALAIHAPCVLPTERASRPGDERHSARPS